MFSGIDRLIMATMVWNGTRHVRLQGYEGKSMARISYVLPSRILALKVKEPLLKTRTSKRRVNRLFELSQRGAIRYIDTYGKLRLN